MYTRHDMLRGDGPFISNEPVSETIKALVIPYATWGGYFGLPATVRYSFNYPLFSGFTAEVMKGAPYADSQLGLFPITQQRGLIEQAMQRWAEVADIHFVNDDISPQVPIYQYMLSARSLMNVRGFAFVPGNMSHATQSMTLGIGYEYDTLRSIYPAQFSVGMYTCLHEIGHGFLGLDHGFEEGATGYKLALPEQQRTQYSVMNYEHSIGRDSVAMIPVTPMPGDIMAAQYVFGPNKMTGAGDTVYSLDCYVPRTSMTHRTMATIWDVNGTDTLDASQIHGDALLDMRDDGMLQFATGSVVFAKGVQVENIIAPQGNADIYLNSANNVVDLRHSLFNHTIYIAPNDAGDDIIFGYEAEHDQIFLTGQNKNISNVMVPFKQCGEVALGDRTIQYCARYQVKFNANNSLVIADAVSETPRTADEKCLYPVSEAANVQPSSFWELFAEFPALFLSDFTAAFMRGGLFEASRLFTEQTLEGYGCTPRQVKIGMIALACLVPLYAGWLAGSNASVASEATSSMINYIWAYAPMVASCAVSMSTAMIMQYMGFSRQASMRAAAVTSTVAASTRRWNTLGVLEGVVTAAGTLFGSGFAKWATSKISGSSVALKDDETTANLPYEVVTHRPIHP